MGDLGQLLREAREQKGVSLEQVEEATRIRQKFLQALEEGNFGALPAETYAKGFLRTYAMYLELDPEELMALYEGRENEGKAALPQSSFFQPMDISMAAPPAVLGWATGNLPEPPNNPQVGMQNMRLIMPALQKAHPAPVGSEGVTLFSVELPRQRRETRIVRDTPAEDIARELLEWLKS